MKNTDKKIALFAGALSLPFLARDALRKNGWDVYVIGLKNFYDPKLNPDLVIRLGGGGTAAKECKKRGIHKLVFVGALGHVNLSDIRPDFWSISVLLSVWKHQRGYDSMAVAFSKALEKRGYEIVAAQDLAPELTFEKPGIQTKVKPAKSDEHDIERAIQVSQTIGREDIGASVVVDKQVIAVEAAEGTAATITVLFVTLFCAIKSCAISWVLGILSKDINLYPSNFICPVCIYYKIMTVCLTQLINSSFHSMCCHIRQHTQRAF